LSNLSFTLLCTPELRDLANQTNYNPPHCNLSAITVIVHSRAGTEPRNESAIFPHSLNLDSCCPSRTRKLTRSWVSVFSAYLRRQQRQYHGAGVSAVCVSGLTEITLKEDTTSGSTNCLYTSHTLRTSFVPPWLLCCEASCYGPSLPLPSAPLRLLPYAETAFPDVHPSGTSH